MRPHNRCALLLTLALVALFPVALTAQVNDACGGATPIGLGTTAFNNSGSAFNGVDLGGGACALAGDTVFDNDLFYCFTAASSGTVEVQFEKLTNSGGIPFDPRIAVLDGCGCPATSANVLACAEGDPIATLQFSAVGGQSYLIVVGSFFAFGTGTGEITITASLPSVVGLSCTDTPTSAELNWALPTFAAGTSYDGGINVYAGGSLITNLPGTATSYTHTPTMFTGPLQLCVEGVSTTLGTAPQECCNVVLGGPANDDCSAAQVVTVGVTAFDSFLSTQDGPALQSCPANATPDIWFLFTPVGTADYDIATCNGTSFDSAIAVYADNGNCPPLAADQIACDVDSCGQQSVVTANLAGGSSYYIRVAGENGQSGAGNLTIQPPCGPLLGLTCDYDCTTETVTLTWVNGDSYTAIDVSRNGQAIATALAGTITTQQDVTPPNGMHVYEVAATCSNGSVVTIDCTVEVLSPTGLYTDLVLSLESQTITFPGMIESVNTLEPQLFNAGRFPAVLRTQFLDYPCLPSILSQVDVIWTLTGTFPFDYRISMAEGDALAAEAANGIGIYFEGSDHWGFNHTASLLDDRDGIDPGATLNGDGSFDEMNGADGTSGPLLAAFATVPYSQDSPSGTDSTDQLSPQLTASLIEVNTVWTNSDNSAGMTEGAYATGVSTVHNDGGKMLSKSWEIGGFGGDVTALVAQYIDFFGFVDPDFFFSRGDCNVDSSVNIADAVAVLSVLFPQNCTPGVNCPVPDCEDACDANDDGAFNIADAVAILSVLFPQNCTPGVNCPTFPEPMSCGLDPTPSMLTCDSFTACP